jgi:DNA-binding NarL/FixJ family response regulator
MRVLLVDDHRLFLEALYHLLTAGGIKVVGMARDGFDALKQARTLRPDLILMDVRMPRCNGIEATRLIKAELPDVKILMLTMSEDEDDLIGAIRNGASGYVLKDVDAQQLFRYLQDAHAGKATFSNGLAARIIDGFKRGSSEVGRSGEARDDEECALSAQQMTILELVAAGHTYKEVAASTSLSVRTIKYHMNEILRRLQLENRAQAIAYVAELRQKCSEGDDTST